MVCFRLPPLGPVLPTGLAAMLHAKRSPVERRLFKAVKPLETGVQGEDLPALLMDKSHNTDTGAHRSVQLDKDANASNGAS